MQAFEKFSWGVGDRENTYRDSGIGWVLLYCIDAMQKDNEILRAISKQLMAKCYSHRAPVIEVLITCSGSTNTVEQQVEDCWSHKAPEILESSIKANLLYKVRALQKNLGC